MERARRGDAAAFDLLLRRYQDRVYNLCYRMCSRHEDALDLTQKTLIRAWEALPRFESRAIFFTWLFRIAVNQVLSHRRLRRPTRSLDAETRNGRWESQIEPEEHERPANRMQREELRLRLEAALEQIEPDYRVAVLLKDVEGLDYAEIAAVLRVPPGTVKSRIHRGRMALRALLLDEDEGLGRLEA